MRKKQHKSGQVLLIAIMLLASVLTVTLTLTFKSTTETQLTKLEEESQKALSAAEAGIEAALRQPVGGSVDISSLNLGGGFTGQATVDPSLTGREFNTNKLSPNEQYTFYLTNYVGPPNMLGTSYWSGTLSVYSRSEPGCPTLEITFIESDNSVTRKVIDPCGNLGGGGPVESVTSGTYNISSNTFRYRTNFSVSNTKLLIVRDLYNATKIGVGGSNNLPNQGKTVISEAKSPTGVTKKVKLFQSYPQIPSEFFVTRF